MAGHDRITPEGKKFFKQSEELKKLQVRVGYQKGKVQEKDGADLAEVAAWNELGTDRIPARPFLRNSADDNKTAIENMCKAQLKAVTNGGSAEQALNALGVMQQGLIQNTISKSKTWAAENAERTIKKKKGKDQPLVDTSLLEQSVSFVIEPKGGGD
jgi:hypothetical protein